LFWRSAAFTAASFVSFAVSTSLGFGLFPERKVAVG